MKKLIKTTAVAVIASTIAFSSANAKTEGNYFGVSLARNNSNLESQKDVSLGVGVDAKHAINFGGAYVAPGVFFDVLNNRYTDENSKTKARARYGVKLDLGYDVLDNASVYVTGGLANVHYRSEIAGQNSKNHSQVATVAGIGANYHVSKDMLVNVEFNRQRASKFKDAADNKNRFDSNSVKVGVAFNF